MFLTRYFTWSFVLAGACVSGTAISQPDVSRQQLRLLNTQQALDLQQRQHETSASLRDLPTRRRELLQQSLDLQRIDQRQLQQRQVRRQQALRQQVRVSPERGVQRLSLQLQGFKREQRQRQLNYTIQRRSGSLLRK